MARLSSIVLAGLALVGYAAAQQGAWAQCGGLNYSGGTTCVSGYSCVVVNDWYWQCQPGSSTPTTTATTTAPASTSTAAPATGIVTRSGTNFMLNGKKFNYVGSNAYWLTFLTNTADVDFALDKFAASGMKVLRIWAFADYTSSQGTSTAFQVWSNGSPTIQTGSAGLQRLDYIVAAALKRGIRLILPLVNNWGDYGGMDVYVDQMAAGSGHEVFYTNSNIKAAYKNYAKAVVSRYSGSPAIFAFELTNEARCSGRLSKVGTCTPATITAWVSEMSAYIKSLDSAHMVSVGDEGFFNRASSSDWFYSGGEGVDFEAYLALSSIDFGTFHLYPSSWSTSYTWGNQYIIDHATAATSAGKPVVFEEYGIPRSTGVRTAELTTWHKTVLANNIAGDMYWQFGTTLPNAGKTHDDTFTIFTDDSDYASLVTSYVTQMEAKNA
ncbi:glycoside hydrolase [Geopyxis carbonaria]|nr:glycoside hydrolase [Geopyxis carbonaria]